MSKTEQFVTMVIIATIGFVVGLDVGQTSVERPYNSSLASCEIQRDAIQQRLLNADSTIRFFERWLRGTGTIK